MHTQLKKLLMNAVPTIYIATLDDNLHGFLQPSRPTCWNTSVTIGLLSSSLVPPQLHPLCCLFNLISANTQPVRLSNSMGTQYAKASFVHWLIVASNTSCWVLTAIVLFVVVSSPAQASVSPPAAPASGSSCNGAILPFVQLFMLPFNAMGFGCWFESAQDCLSTDSACSQWIGSTFHS